MRRHGPVTQDAGDRRIFLQRRMTLRHRRRAVAHWARSSWEPRWDTSSVTGVCSFWIDPWAWAVRTPLAPGTATTNVSGALPVSLYGRTVVLSDARGRVYRVNASATDGAFVVTVPAGTYVLCVVQRDSLGRETFLAVARFGTGTPPNTLFPTQPSGGNAVRRSDA